MTTTKDVLLPLATSSLACSATLIELTIPQVVRLSRPTAEPLPTTPLTARLAMLPRLIGPQTALTVVQFGCIRELRDAMDRWRGPHPLHLSLSYGLVSGPCRSAAYNLLIAGTYAHHGRASPGDASLERFWRTKVVPGLAWSVLRDSGSVGGGIVVAPLVVPRDASPPVKFLGGLGCGACCGLATQLFHNAALTAGRMAEAGKRPSNFEALRRCLAEHGASALYVNYPYRVAVIALWTGILHVADPFRL